MQEDKGARSPDFVLYDCKWCSGETWMTSTTTQRDEVIVNATWEFRRVKCNATGQTLLDAMQACPYRDVDIEPKRGTMPVRVVSCDGLVVSKG